MELVTLYIYVVHRSVRNPEERLLLLLGPSVCQDQCTPEVTREPPDTNLTLRNLNKTFEHIPGLIKSNIHNEHFS
jgi:hypothetical protein